MLHYVTPDIIDEVINQLSIDVMEIGGKVEDFDTVKTESRFSALKSRFGLKVAAASTAGGALVASASAETINWTSLIEMIEGAASIFPSIGSMVIAIVPTLMILAVIGFVLYFFDAILEAVGGALSIFSKRR